MSPTVTHTQTDTLTAFSHPTALTSIVKHHFLNLDDARQEKRSWWAITKNNNE